MHHLATQRLLQASAALEPVDRALLNLWINHGLDDEQLATFTGITAEAVGARRHAIVAALSRRLDLPEDDIREALNQIEPAEPIRVRGGRARNDSPPQVEASPHPPETKPASSEPVRRRRRVGPALGGAVLAAIAIVVALVLLLSDSPPQTRQVKLSSAPASAPSTAASSTPPPTSTTSRALAGLPGGLTHTRGAVALGGHPPYLKLRLTVRHLPALTRGHYEAWLFNSVVDSHALGRVWSGSHTRSFALPSGARGYHFVDITRQSPGTTVYSGETELRAINPVAAGHR